MGYIGTSFHDVRPHHLEAIDMSGDRVTGMCLLAFSVLCFSIFADAAPAACQAAQLPEKPEQHQHHHMDLPSGANQKCDPKFTYEEGPYGPSHWEGDCNTGRMQSPVDITKSEKLPISMLEFKYQPVDLEMVNDCNKYQIKVKFPGNYWLKVARKPYFLTELHFHEPGENAVNGKRPPMVIHLVHLSPESTFLVIEVPVAVGKENPVIKTLWQHIPAKGKGQKVPGVKINAMDLLPADHSFYRFPGSLTTPLCNEGVEWYLMKNPIEMSEAQIAKYKKYYHDTARPLQPLNDRPVAEPSQ
jgi:carbonic anhydrase